MTPPENPLLTKRKNRKVIGWRHERHYCLNCMPEEGEAYSEELREGDDAGVPFECWKCQAELKPADDATQVEA